MAINVLVVDDSAVVRQVLQAILNEAPDINVYAVASDPIFAQNHMKTRWPDVIVLDMEMPRMDGLTFLRQIMLERPTPVVICSSLAEKGAELTIQALAAGAVDVVTKPKLGVKGFLQDTKQELCQIIRAAAASRASKLAPTSAPSKPVKTPSHRVPEEIVHLARTTEHIVAIGTSTGGTQALEYILTRLPRTAPGIVIVQHMPEKFTAAFAERIDGIAEIEVLEAQTGDRILRGRALIAPGGHHMEVERSGAQFVVKVFRGPAVNRHCPSVDVLFRSMAKRAGKNATGIIMTGMGDDGARGLLEMRRAGARTIAQDEESCVVFGMPKEAIKLKAASEIASLNAMHSLITD
ncbi:two-component system chemotaxis response regulator CheB [Alteromonadaceae bacterium 2753L.S.0a.02]|nr:two-component system chemotaxis response regulator CheB [Alteromonadaceae bacterium 2753L.S.0a.02]